MEKTFYVARIAFGLGMFAYGVSGFFRTNALMRALAAEEARP